MGTIMWLWAATFAWVGSIPLLFAGADRIGAGLGAAAYAFAWLAAIVVVVVPTLRGAPLHRSLPLLLAVFVAARLLSSALLGAEPLRWLVECGYVGVAIALASRLGRAMASADQALEAIAAGRVREQVARFDEAQEEIYREIRRARRYERPASLIALSAAGADGRSVERLVREVQQELAQKYADGQVAKLLLHETDAAALVTRRDDHFVVLLPEVEADRAQRMAKRLGATAADRWGLQLCSGIASFPEQEVTFEGLLERAESELRVQERLATFSGGDPVAERDAGTPPPGLARESNGSAAPTWSEG